MRKFLTLTAAAALVVAFGFAETAKAVPTKLGPSPYLCFDTAATTATGDCAGDDSPFKGLDFSGGFFHLEDFEGQALNTPGATATGPGLLFLCPGGTNIDSVDEDDDAIDDANSTGCSNFATPGSTGITYTFDDTALGDMFPTHVGIVWTDGLGAVTFNAFDETDTLIGVCTSSGEHVAVNDGFVGQTAEDRFFGCINDSGIKKIVISNASGGIEVDHLQYGKLTGIRIRKEITSGPDLDFVDGIDIAIQINQTTTTPYDFTITYIPDESDPDNVIIIDTVPAEWDVEFIDDEQVTDTNLAPKGPQDTGVGVGCGNFESGLGDDDNVTVERGGKLNKICSSDTDILWTLTPSLVLQTLKVDVTTRQSPSGKLRFKPTSCGKLTLNDGAQAFEADEFGDLVLDGGEPIEVGDPSNSLMLVAVDDLDLTAGLVGDGSGDEDGDTLTDADEAFIHGTNPCLKDTDGDGLDDDVEVAGPTDPTNPDTDNDGVLDGDDSCPLEGPPTGEDTLGVNGCIIPANG